ncbi:exopolysaccharide biosynthesis protein [Streptomyces sp. AcH 505]|uniref:acyltransferase family protein n=1 Tax=Streptomyces sp. AcH 505 TaxID=352211 RepID=UPI000591D800|nr:exopolysaccharide biosynthesis protein [Streptomyces sp. AcH 505]
MTDKSFVPSVQGLRGLAAVSVLIVHLYDMPLLAGFLPSVPRWFQQTINMGGHGVELFFMISGFLIPASLVRHASVSKFFYDRMLRILPVFVILHLALFVIGPIVGYKFFKDIGVVAYVEVFLANLFFLPDALGLPIGQQNAWTLAYEWAFYIWFAATFFVVVERKNWMLGLLLLAIGLAGVFHRPIAAYFAVGMLFAAVDVRFRVTGWFGVLAGVICGITMYVCLEYIHPFVGLVPGALLFGMVLAPGSGVAKALSGPVLQYLGKISYSFYLVHPFALYPLQMMGVKLAAHGFSLWALWAAFVGLGLVASLVAGAVSYELIEVRLRRWLDATFRQAPSRPLGEVGHHA